MNRRLPFLRVEYETTEINEQGIKEGVHKHKEVDIIGDVILCRTKGFMRVPLPASVINGRNGNGLWFRPASETRIFAVRDYFGGNAVMVNFRAEDGAVSLDERNSYLIVQRSGDEFAATMLDFSCDELRLEFFFGKNAEVMGIRVQPFADLLKGAIRQFYAEPTIRKLGIPSTIKRILSDIPKIKGGSDEQVLG